MTKSHLPDLEADPVRFTEVVLGLEWIKDTPPYDQTKKRPQLPNSPDLHNWLQQFAQTGIFSLSGGYKAEEEEAVLDESRLATIMFDKARGIKHCLWGSV